MSRRIDLLTDVNLKSFPNSRCFWWEGAWYDNAFFASLVDECEQKLRLAQFIEGQRIAVLMPNSPSFLALIFAVWRLGGTVCPLNVNSGLPSIIETLKLLDPFTVVISDTMHKKTAEEFQSLDWSYVALPLMGPFPDIAGEPTEPESTEIAVIFSTSGTTGKPKAVPLSHENLINNCEGCMRALKELNANDVILNVLPNFHSFGFTIGSVLSFLLKGGQAVVPSFLPPHLTLQAITSAPATVLLLVPMMLSYLLNLIAKGAPQPKDVKIIIVGGDRYNCKMDEKVEKLMGVGVLEGYGITECSPVLSLNKGYTRRRLGTVGEFLDNFEWQLRSEEGKLLDGNEGVLWVKGPCVSSGYFRVQESDRTRFDEGWFNTGDYVSIEDGYVRIIDRVTDIIAVGGFKVYPQEIEGILQAHPAVQAAVVVGVPHPSSGEILKAYIQKKPEAQVTESEISHYCKTQLAHYKVPRKLEFVESLPMSGTGKILRRVLREKERAAAKEKQEVEE